MKGVRSGNLNPEKSNELEAGNRDALFTVLDRVLRKAGGTNPTGICCFLPSFRKTPHCAAQTSSLITISFDHSLSNSLQSVTLREAQLP